MIDVRTARWADWVAHAETKIAEVHASIETPGLDALQTELLRGKIAAWREFIDIGRVADLAAFPTSDSYGR